MSTAKRKYTRGRTRATKRLSPVQGFATKQQVGSAFPVRLRKTPAQATLRLSKRALTAPLPRGWINDLRLFLTRSGKWRRHPIESREMFVMAPAAGVLAEPRAIGPVTKPLFASLGFANGMVVKGNEVHVDTNVCASLMLGSLRPGDPFCGTFLCVPLAAHWPVDPGDGYFGCMGFSVSGESDWTPCNGSYYGPCDGAYSGPCETLVGPEPCNGDYQCGFMCGPDQYSGPGVGPSFDDLWDHPFVQGLRAYFNVASAEDLQADVGYFVGRNLYDASAVRK